MFILLMGMFISTIKTVIRKALIRIPERPSGLAFGGKDKNTLFITGRSALYRVSLSAFAP